MKYKNKQLGFTLIELLVAMGLFLVVVVLASGTFIRVLRIERQSVELIAVNDAASLSLEQMAREIRTGVGFTSSNADTLSFISASSKKVVYHFNSNSGVIERSENNGAFEPLTAANVLVTKLVFLTSGLAADDGLQSRITIALSVSSRVKDLQGISTNLQTTISPRSF